MWWWCGSARWARVNRGRSRRSAGSPFPAHGLRRAPSAPAVGSMTAADNRSTLGHPGRRMSREDTEIVASQLAELTRSVEKLAAEVKAMETRAVNAQDRADTQQERIDLAARELAEVSQRLQAAANALRESV